MAQFSDIPAELRNLIYQFLLLQSPNMMERSSNTNALSLFGVSQQIHDEAASYFYQNNQICIDTPFPPTETATILPPVADRYLRFLRRLRVRATIAAADSITHARIANTITSLVVIGATFDDVHIHIQSSLSQLVNSRVDDSILGAEDPITVALRTLLNSGVTKVVHLHLCGVWFTPCVIQDLRSRYGDVVVFVDRKGSPQDSSSVQRQRTGTYAATHMTSLGFVKEATGDVRSPHDLPAQSTASSLSSSVDSALADMDMFSVTDFERGSDDSHKDQAKGEATSHDSFFSEADIEEWEASTQELDDASEPEDMDLDNGSNGEDEDEDKNEDELDDVMQDDFDVIMGNMEDMAHHLVNEADMTYMTNFAPELLLARPQLERVM